MVLQTLTLEAMCSSSGSRNFGEGVGHMRYKPPPLGGIFLWPNFYKPGVGMAPLTPLPPPWIRYCADCGVCTKIIPRGPKIISLLEAFSCTETPNTCLDKLNGGLFNIY